jgi:glycosyltransferase involved in cell wall biosynthesis
MRIAYVGPFGFHPNKTMRSRALGLARPLAQQGHTVRLFMPPWQTPHEADKIWSEDGVEIRYTPLRGGLTGITRNLIREVMAWQPDVIHTFKPKAYAGLVAWWVWHTARGRVRLFTDTDDWEGWGGWNELAPYLPLQKRFFAWQEQWGLSHHHGLTVASRALETIALSMGVSPQKVLYLPNGSGIGPDTAGTETKRSSLRLTDRPTILLYSRLFEFDPIYLVDILSRVQAEIPEMAVLGVGAGLYDEDAAAFRHQLEQHGLAHAFTDVGWVEETELPAVLACADVGLYLMADTLLNRTKCPVKLADMLQVGVPVVGEAVGQVAEYVRHGETGLLCQSGDGAGIAAALVDLLRDGEKRQKFAAAGQQHLNAHFAWPVLADKLLTLYTHRE